MAKTSKTNGAWLTGRQAMALTGRNMHTLMKYAALGRLTIRAEPGESLRYLRADVERLAAEGR